MGKIRKIELSTEQLAELAAGIRTGKSHAYRQRCQLVMLKSEGRSSKEVAAIIKMNAITINNWLNRYELEGIAGLKTKVLLEEQLGKEFSLKTLKRFLKKLSAATNASAKG
jgi:hypothetical protein